MKPSPNQVIWAHVINGFYLIGRTFALVYGLLLIINF